MKDYNFKINGNEYRVSLDKIDEHTAEVKVNGTEFHVEFEGMGKPKQERHTQVSPIPSSAAAAPAAKPTVAKPSAESAPASAIKSPLPGVILDIKVKPGDRITPGTTILILEAMKMENNIDADREGTVQSVKVNRGDSVLEGDILITIE